MTCASGNKDDFFRLTGSRQHTGGGNNPQDPYAVWTVSEVNALLREILENTFMPLWVSGEIGNLTVHRSGHVYLTLKDADSQIRAVFFGGAVQFRQLNLREGDRIEAFGRLSVYAARGEYQLNIRTLRLCGLGELQQKFELLKQKLSAKGYFDESRKRPVPRLPKRIGIISSTSGAALKDFLKIALTRFPNLQIQICPAPVQGKGAELKLARAIRFFNRIRSVDVIVLTRGGGSLEDLWPFNEEVLADAIFESRIPVVSAVGHEIDFTIADFTADIRAPTPSGAAELLIPEKAVLLQQLDSLNRRAETALNYSMLQARHKLDRLLSSRIFHDSASFILEKMQTVDLFMRDAENALHNAMMNAEHRLTQGENALKAYDPALVLKRGYAIVLDSRTGKPRTSVQEIHCGDALTLHLADGEISATAGK